MAFGFSTKNDGGFTQVDNTYSSYSYDQSGSVVLAPGDTPAVALTSRGGNIPLVFLRIAGTTQSIICTDISAIDFSLRAPTSNSTNVTIEWFTCAPVKALTGSGTFGVKIFTPAGDLAFDSRRSFIRVRQAKAISVTTAETLTTVDAMPGGTKPYYLANLLTGTVKLDASGGNFIPYELAVRQASNTSFGTRTFAIGSFPGSATADTYASSLQLVTCAIPVSA